MDRQKLLIGTLSAIIALAVLFFVYQQMNKSHSPSAPKDTGKEMSKEASQPLPSTATGVAEEIEAQAALDEAALDAEVSAEIEDVNEDSESLNNLTEAYDENSL